MRLIVVRHGETEWNTQKRTQGTTDIKLTARGLQQARQLSRRLADMQIDRVITSPLARAYDTAREIALPRNVPLETDSALLEIHFGSWEGLTFEQIGRQYPNELSVWSKTPHLSEIPNAERVCDVIERVDGFLNRMRTEHPDETIAAVTHSLPSKLIVARAIGLPFENLHSLRIDNASLNILDFYPERTVLRVMNETVHLHEGAPWPQ